MLHFFVSYSLFYERCTVEEHAMQDQARVFRVRFVGVETVSYVGTGTLVQIPLDFPLTN